VIRKKIDSILEIRLKEAEAELTARDYRVTKAVRLGKPVEELYPGETEWYEAQVTKINDFKAKIEARDAAAKAASKRRRGRGVT
jgi:hypothetical protein